MLRRPIALDPQGSWTVQFATDLYAGTAGTRPIDGIDDVVLVISVEGDVRW